MATDGLTIGVVVPTYLRPAYLERCVKALALQERAPDEVILVSRDTDAPTIDKIRELQAIFGARFPIRHATVSEPGFLPPVRRGIEVIRSDIVAFIDDDAEAFPDWTRRLVDGYSSEGIGGVGGRCVNLFDGVPASYPVAHQVGRLYWYGRAVGNMYRDTSFQDARQVHFLLGGNMSYRRAVLDRVVVDPVIGNNVAVNWELDVGLQVRRLGYGIVFDPKIRINHHSAPRAVEGMRTLNADGVYWSNFNYSYLMMKHLSPIGSVAYAMHSILIGGTTSSGIAHWVLRGLTGRPVDWRKDLLPSLKGRFNGAMAYWGRGQGNARGRERR